MSVNELKWNFHKLFRPIDHVDVNQCLVLFLFFAGVKLTLSALIDGKSLNQGGHKLGLGLDLEA